jgi:hypothetical protein
MIDPNDPLGFKESLSKEISHKDAFNLMLERSQIVQVLFDPRGSGVEIPKDPNELLILEYGLNLAKPIYDLKVDDVGIEATLSFSNTPIRTRVPWASVVMIRSTDDIRTQPPIEKLRVKLTSIPEFLDQNLKVESTEEPSSGHF